MSGSLTKPPVESDEEIVLSEEEEQDGVCHLVHVECQVEIVPQPPFVTSMCGLALDWEERNANSDRPTCPACKESWQCPACKRWRFRL